MSGQRTALPAGRSGLLRGSRTRSYGSLVRSTPTQVHQSRIEHIIQPGETLQGLALKYGVSMEQIKRANRLYTNDSIFLKRTLSIPVVSDLDGCSNEAAVTGQDSDGGVSEGKPDECKAQPSDLTPEEFLKRLDDLINQSKHAAVRGCQEGETRVAALEAACNSRMSERGPLRRSQSAVSPPRLMAVPLTVTKLTKNLRDREDEIFEL